MSLFWPIFWFGLILSAIGATVVVAIMDQSKRKAAMKAMESRQTPEFEEELGESMENIDSFPAEENFEFSELDSK